ncbi:ferritin-like domain-containing protein [Streptomyces sp. NPDC091209]|uniref:ferritin-like domain-containing protein n=1 Tax=Streptomyces sp. NPDC091209 TaxID=3365974 RepID=UPI0038280EE8
MSTRIYALPIDQTRWQVPGGGTTVFDWEYDEGRDRLLSLYEKGKQKQWDAAERLDWSIDIDLDNPMGVPEQTIAIYGSEVWSKLSQKDKGVIRHHLASWQFSQFLHGEQGALICSSKIVHTVPDLDSKFYAATQVMDEARHVEVYSRYLREKLGLAYPINPSLKSILDDVISDARWDMTYLGMQVLIEGLALAAFGLIRDNASEPLAQALNTYVMQDEARHVAFGRLALRDYYPELTQAERDEREEFCIEACYLMQERFVGEEVWRNLDIDSDECIEFMRNSEHFRAFRSHLFSRIVPTLKDIGLFGPKMRNAFSDMGIIGYEHHDVESLMEQDEKIASDLDRSRIEQVEKVIQRGGDEA